MLRTSLIALVALTLAACDDEDDTAAVSETEVEVAESTGATGDATTEAQTAETEVETKEVEIEVVEQETVEAGSESAPTEDTETAASSASTDSGATESASTESDETVAAGSDENFGTETPAPLDESAATQDEQVSTTTDGSEAEAMQSYRDWLLGSWGVNGQCDSRLVELQEDSLSLPGGISCDDLQVQASSGDTLVLSSQSCQGAGSDGSVEIEASRTGDGVTLTRQDREAQLTRCE